VSKLQGFVVGYRSEYETYYTEPSGAGSFRVPVLRLLQIKVSDDGRNPSTIEVPCPDDADIRLGDFVDIELTFRRGGVTARPRGAMEDR
jgi:hypothetical protein